VAEAAGGALRVGQIFGLDQRDCVTGDITVGDLRSPGLIVTIVRG